MENKEMVDDIVAMLDSSISSGVGHLNLEVESDTAKSVRSIETLGCTDCARNPLACSIPTLHEGLDDFK